MKLRANSFLCGQTLESGCAIISYIGCAWSVFSLVGAEYLYAHGYERELYEYFVAFSHIIASGLLRYGVKAKNSSCLFTWLVIVSLENVKPFGTFLSQLSDSIHYGYPYHPEGFKTEDKDLKFDLAIWHWLATAFILFFIVLDLYFMRIVYSYYKKLKAKDERKAKRN